MPESLANPDQGFFHTPAEGKARARVLFLHGAGGPADTPWMDQVAAGLGDAGLNVYRAEFGYMAQRRTGGKKRPPPKAETLLSEVAGMIKHLPESHLPLWLAGKSMGGRIATMWAAQTAEDQTEEQKSEVISHLAVPERVLVFGYPFHPPGKPDRLRIAHLPQASCPIHILQGTRDPMGSQSEVAELDLGDSVHITWVEDGNHDLRPRGLTRETVWPALVEQVSRLL